MRLAIADDVAWVPDDQSATVYVTRPPDGEPVVLEGSAGWVWRALAGGAGDAEAVALAAAALAGTAVDDDIRTDVRRFLDRLLDAGLVAPAAQAR